MNSKIALSDIRGLAEAYVKENLPDEHPFFTLVWDQIGHPLSIADRGLPSNRSSWLDAFLPKGLGFSKQANVLLYTPAVILALEAIAIELKAKLTVPTENEVRIALIGCASAFGLPKQAASHLGQSLAPKMRQHLSAILSGQPVQSASSQASSQPFPLEVANHPYVFKRFGSRWWVSFNEERGWVEHTVGMAIISVLLQHPRKSFSPFTLRENAGLNPAIEDSKSEQLSAMSDEDLGKEKMTRDNKIARIKSDPSIRKNLPKALDLIRERIQEARQSGDLARVEELEDYEERLLQEMKESDHGHLTDLEDVRARKAVDIAIRRQLQAFKEQRFQKLHEHLKDTLRVTSGDRMYVTADDSIAWLV